MTSYGQNVSYAGHLSFSELQNPVLAHIWTAKKDFCMVVFLQTIQDFGGKIYVKISVLLPSVDIENWNLGYSVQIHACQYLPFRKQQILVSFGLSLRHIPFLSYTRNSISPVAVHDGEMRGTRGPKCCRFWGMDWPVSKKPQAGLQGPEEREAGKRYESEPASVPFGRRWAQIEVTMGRE